MRQKQFEEHYQSLWQLIEQQLARPEIGGAQLPQQYRQLCQCLALAQQRGYSPALVDYLQRLVQQVHPLIYGCAVERPLLLRTWLLHDLPQRVRQEWRLLLLAMLAFWGVGLLTGLLVWLDPSRAYMFSDSATLGAMQESYGSGFADGRGGEDKDFYMFAFYIWNNVSIGFRTFAAGIFAGVPALLSLLLNGMHVGVVAAWLSRDPATSLNFWSFVITHASVEVTGLLLSAVGGMRLGLALIMPGRLSRRHALQQASMRMFPVLAGAVLLTLLAAFIEGFWSASAMPAQVKLAVGALAWVAVIAFFLLAGRKR